MPVRPAISGAGQGEAVPCGMTCHPFLAALGPFPDDFTGAKGHRAGARPRALGAGPGLAPVGPGTAI